MSLNYRVLHRANELAIHEVFYSDSGDVIGITETPVYPRAESIEELREELARYRVALDLPVLSDHEIAKHDDVPGATMPNDVRVYFGVFGDWADPSAVTAVVGRAPSSFKTIGTPISQMSTALRRQSVWTIESGLARNAPVEDQLTAVLDLLEPHGDGVRKAAQSYSAGIMCASYWKTATPGVHISEEQVRRMAVLSLSFDLDMYFLE